MPAGSYSVTFAVTAWVLVLAARRDTVTGPGSVSALGVTWIMKSIGSLTARATAPKANRNTASRAASPAHLIIF